MSVIGSSILAGASGSAGGDKVYVDDVFSTFLYTGNSGTTAITNGLDLAGEGGLVWTKGRNYNYDHHLFDTERGVTKYLQSSQSAAEATQSTSLTSFNSNGFTLGPDSDVNDSNIKYVSWTFRKAPGFFDVQAISTANVSGATQTFSHNLGSAPGMMWVKSTGSGHWVVYHKSLGHTFRLLLNDNGGGSGPTTDFWGIAPTSTHFSLGSSFSSAGTYIVYLFADNDAQFGTDADESIIKCGNYTGTGSGSNPTISLGFEPQWVILKNTSNSSNWIMADTMRGWTSSGTSGDSITMCANLPGDEITNGGRVKLTSTGFTMDGESNVDYNTSGHNYVYMAIRRPNKPPEAATEVFAIDTSEGTAPTPPQFTSGFVTDLALRRTMTNGNSVIGSRLQGTNYMNTANAGTESGASVLTWDFSDGWSNSVSDPPNADMFAYMFKRAPGFMDVVAYSGNGQNRMINHNLAAVPEMYICKKRNGSGPWYVYHSATGNGAFTYFYTNSTSNSSVWNNTSPTATQFSVGANESNVNGSSGTFISYLFATLPGVSKVGSYTGTGNDINVNCGFTNGARFVLIKRTDVEIQGTTQDTDWYLWDTTRGIGSGNSPWFALNESQAQVTNTDYIDPLSTGFTITAGAGNGLNVATKLFIFLAIA